LGASTEFTVESGQRADAIELTDRINTCLSDLETAGEINVWVPHTTAGITVNESADPNVMTDMIDQFEQFVPWSNNYQHIEDNAAAHIKSQLLGSHQWLPVTNDRLDLGRWQGVFLLEWDGPRTRTVQLHANR